MENPVQFDRRKNFEATDTHLRRGLGAKYVGATQNDIGFFVHAEGVTPAEIADKMSKMGALAVSSSVPSINANNTDIATITANVGAVAGVYRVYLDGELYADGNTGTGAVSLELQTDTPGIYDVYIYAGQVSGSVSVEAI